MATNKVHKIEKVARNQEKYFARFVRKASSKHTSKREKSVRRGGKAKNLKVKYRK